jgi:YHS domain-containing protein
MRLLIFLGLVYLCYRVLKSWMLKHSPAPRTNAGQTAGEIDDVMIKDPVCEVYFPRKDGVHLKAGGQDLFFCSTACRDKFVHQHSKK